MFPTTATGGGSVHHRRESERPEKRGESNRDGSADRGRRGCPTEDIHFNRTHHWEGKDRTPKDRKAAFVADQRWNNHRHTEISQNSVQSVTPQSCRETRMGQAVLRGVTSVHRETRGGTCRVSSHADKDRPDGKGPSVPLKIVGKTIRLHVRFVSCLRDEISARCLKVINFPDM
jgi:hypothetical protein